MSSRFLRAFFNAVSALLTRRVVFGMENLPSSGPYLLVVNHLSVFDLPLIFGLIGSEKVTGWAAEKYQRHPFFGPLLKMAGGIFIERGQVDRDAIDQAVVWLRDGNIFGMAPEGTRSPTHAMARGKTGAAYLAHEAQVLIVPFGIHGTENALSTWLRLRRPTITLHIGVPFRLPKLDPEQRHARLRADTDEIMCHIAALIPTQYHGYYAAHPRLQVLLHARTENPS
ncbi:MAG: 1-acyl-sn-glycerol-3-phosphate acyltransferase [Anaerolineales bacterium]|nr:MAG: 1-acyl-sn-glycerol-3-phosphate acyltransferase [Anaerolineales bacterium]